MMVVTLVMTDQIAPTELLVNMKQTETITMSEQIEKIMERTEYDGDDGRDDGGDRSDGAECVAGEDGAGGDDDNNRADREDVEDGADGADGEMEAMEAMEKTTQMLAIARLVETMVITERRGLCGCALRRRRSSKWLVERWRVRWRVEDKMVKMALMGRTEKTEATERMV